MIRAKVGTFFHVKGRMVNFFFGHTLQLVESSFPERAC